MMQKIWTEAMEAKEAYQNGLFNIREEYLEKSILRPNNLSLPLNRINFINLLKSSKFH